MLKTLAMLALLAPAANAAQIATQYDETTIADAADTPLEHDCACLTASTCEEIEMSQIATNKMLEADTAEVRALCERIGEGRVMRLASDVWKARDPLGACDVGQPFGITLRGGEPMTFGAALELLKRGVRVAREGWNGKGMWLAYMPDMTVPEGMVNARTKAHGVTGDLHVGGYIVMWTAQGVWQPGWLASQADMLADDWVVVS